ncbi:MAG: hypothetical protein U5K79_08770 [Cyclobacteriaceae bacterium]|nr:hypothetical protein [Cyclobacteriaceae bacterium]
MMRTTTRFSGGFLLLFAAAAIIGVFFYYFFFIVKEREDKIISRGYRVLENVSKNILDKKSIYDNSHLRFYNTIDSTFSNPEIVPIYVSSDSSLFTRAGDFGFSDSLKLYGYFNKYAEQGTTGGIISVDNFFKGVRYDDFFSNLSVFDSSCYVLQFIAFRADPSQSRYSF